MERNLTKGEPINLILMFALPLYIGQMFLLGYSLIDTRIIGSILGSTSLAAVGATTALSDLLLEFENGIICGFGIVITRYYGAGDKYKMGKAIGNAVFLSVVFTIVLSAGCIFSLPHILSFLHVSDQLYPEAYAYISIIIAGMVASSVYNICAAILRSVGDSFTPLIFLIISNVLNVIFDILFIASFHMGVSGAAVATVLTQLLSAVMCYIYMRKKHPFLVIHFKEMLPDIAMYKEMIPSGLSMGFMLSFVLLGSLALQTSINLFEPDIIVAHTGARKATMIFLTPFFVSGTALATYCGQNKGAKEYARIQKGVHDTILASALWCVIVLLVVFLFASGIVMAITASTQADVVYNAVWYLRINSIFYILPAIICILRNSMQGFGDTETPLISSMIELIGKVVIAYLLVPRIQYMGVIIAEPIVWAIMIIPLLIKWKKAKAFFTR